MRIEDDIKLDYSDVLIRPKRSTLSSRHDVDMKRTYTFVHSGSVDSTNYVRIWIRLERQKCTMFTQQYNMITCPVKTLFKK